MSNLKKIVIGLGVVACLATAGFSEEVKLKSSFWEQRVNQDFCKAYDYFNHQRFVYQNDTSLSVHRSSIKESGDQIFTTKYGALSTDMLKENGIGYSVNMNWGNISLAFDDYLRYANSKEDQINLGKFMMSLNYYSEIFKLDSRITEKESKEVTMYYMTTIEYNFYKEGKQMNGGSFVLTDFFRFVKGKEKELYAPFAKYVINRDFERAREYIKSTNKKTGINSIYQRFENACEK